MHVHVAGSQSGAVAVQSAAPRQPAQAPRVRSQRGVGAAQSASLAHATQRPTVVSQSGALEPAAHGMFLPHA